MQDATIAAFWSAVAATCSALAALLGFTIQRRNLHEAVRCELVLTGIQRIVSGEGAGSTDCVSFSGLKNVGKGVALHVNAFVDEVDLEAPTAVMSNARAPIIPSGAEESVSGSVMLWWTNVKPLDGSQLIVFRVRILAWDNRNRRHETVYAFGATPIGSRTLFPQTIAPNLMLMSRHSRSRSVWMLKLFSRLARIPALGKRFTALAR